MQAKNPAYQFGVFLVHGKSVEKQLAPRKPAFPAFFSHKSIKKATRGLWRSGYCYE
jgi:hypothetical protein